MICRMRLRVKEARREESRRDRPQSASSSAEEWGRERSEMSLRKLSGCLRLYSGVAYEPSFFSRRCFSTLHPSTLAACVNPRQTSALAVPSQFTHPLELPVRFKSKGQSKVKHESAPVKAENLSEDIRSTLHEAEMEKEFARILDRFQDDLFLKLCLKLTPEHFFSLPIPGERVRLGEVASIVSQNARSSTGQHPSSQILVDLSGRPELFAVARSAVAKFLADSGPQTKRRNASASAVNSDNDLIQSAGPTQFTVQVRSVVTGEVRSDLIKQGRDLLTRTKKEMDRVYQKYSRLLHSPTLKTFSEDKKRLAGEYLKTVVRAQHSLADEVWRKKEQELQNS
ncbi:hypothetical protein SprV_0602161900 [Sparganum proliferum]